jgi:hypothetical protein
VWAGPLSETVLCPLIDTKPVPADGVWIDHLIITTDDTEPRVALKGPWGPRVLVRLFTAPSFLSVPELRLEVTVDEYSSELEIGLGPDGRVAKAILQSIRALPGAGSGFHVGAAGSG